MDDQNLTLHAAHALKLSDLFARKFLQHSVGKTAQRKIHVSEPDSMSTDGGRKARQNITLQGSQGDRGALVCGWFDVGRASAELRSYDMVSQQFESRYGSSFDVTRGEYDQLVDEMLTFLKNQRLQVTVVDTRPPSFPQPGARPSVNDSAEKFSPTMGVMMAMLGAGLLIGLLVGYVIFEVAFP